MLHRNSNRGEAQHNYVTSKEQIKRTHLLTCEYFNTEVNFKNCYLPWRFETMWTGE